MTYKIAGVEMEKQPVVKRFRLQPIGTRLDGSPQKGKWQFQLNFEILRVEDAERIGHLYLSGTTVPAHLQNPETGAFQDVSGVSIASWSFTPSTLDNGFGSMVITLSNVEFG